MEASEEESNSVASYPKDDSEVNDNLNTSNYDRIPVSLACDEQNTQESQVESVSNSCPNEADDEYKESAIGFKKPQALIIGPKRGKIGKVGRVMDNKYTSPSSSISSIEPSLVNEETIETIHQENNDKHKADKSTSKSAVKENVISDTKSIPIPYFEPSWSGEPEEEYKLEVLKSGVILETIDLTKKNFHVVGRLPSCDLSLAHPTISRHHAIIQYRTVEDEKNSRGFYLYDLESTHGTFWNGHRIKPRVYVRLHGGHMIRFGCSQRKYILQAPLEDQEEESELSITQLKEKRLEELREREIRQKEEEEAEERARKAEEENGIDWGMGEDADEDTDLTENPYASMADEELYLDDPKKTLRGWFEREGYDLQYHVEEKGIGQFLCWINLPKECFGGHSIKAEALVKGKKKESVIQCALEACRILDRHGLLRQANHESRKKKRRNWEEEDYYDSDEDNFLDRTGTIERKREQRMKQAGKLEEKVETYSSLSGKHSEIVNKISYLDNCLKEAQKNTAKGGESNEDSLDAFMSSLNTSTLSKSDVTKMKIELQNLRKEEVRLVKLINLTKPANLPPLASEALMDNKDPSYQRSKSITGKILQPERRGTLLTPKGQNDSRKVHPSALNSDSIDEEEEEEEEDEDNIKEEKEDKTCTNEGAYRVNIQNLKYEKSAPDKEEVKSQNSVKSDDKTTSKNTNVNIEANKHADIGSDRKRKKDRLAKKLHKSIKKHYDQDVHSADYSTWVPPQGQTGDGRTSLNDKYGY